MKIKYKVFQYYFPIALSISIILIIAGFVFPAVLDWKLIITLVGSIISSIYFIEKQKLEQMALFKELFTDFNRRYDGMNERLNQILEEDQEKPLSKDQIHLLYDYFNLCGEEYLFYKQGLIYPEVWKAWSNGIKIFGKNKRIRDLWQKEAQSDSYYGLKSLE
ncbi:MAG: hypothetical protein FJ110_08070 [Deltaproteobacteria bacterium]|nr:hypothetical protein [Deltaproteobacteria bacterium]